MSLRVSYIPYYEIAPPDVPGAPALCADIPRIDRAGSGRVVSTFYDRPGIPKNRHLLPVYIETHQVFILLYRQCGVQSFGKLFKVELGGTWRGNLDGVSATQDSGKLF